MTDALHSKTAGLHICDTPEKIKLILAQFRSDSHLSKAFTGSTNKGTISGFYRTPFTAKRFALGYVKINGTYDLREGWIQLKAVPSVLYWGLIAFCALGTIQFAYLGSAVDSRAFFGCIFTLSFALIVSGIFLVEKKRFFKHLQRIHDAFKSNPRTNSAT